MVFVQSYKNSMVYRGRSLVLSYIYITLSPTQVMLINIIIFIIIALLILIVLITLFLRRNIIKRSRSQNIKNENEHIDVQQNISEPQQFLMSPIASARFLASKGEYRKAIIEGYFALRKELSVMFMVTYTTYMTEYEIIKNILEKAKTSSFRNVNENLENVLIDLYKLYERARFSKSDITIDDYNIFMHKLESVRKLLGRGE